MKVTVQQQQPGGNKRDRFNRKLEKEKEIKEASAKETVETTNPVEESDKQKSKDFSSMSNEELDKVLKDKRPVDTAKLSEQEEDISANPPKKSKKKDKRGKNDKKTRGVKASSVSGSEARGNVVKFSVPYLLIVTLLSSVGFFVCYNLGKLAVNMGVL